MRLGDSCLLGVLGLGLAMGLVLAIRKLAGCCRARAAKKRSLNASRVWLGKHRRPESKLIVPSFIPSSARAGYRDQASRRSETQEKSGTYTPCTHPTFSAYSMCTTMEEVEVDKVVVDYVEKASVNGPDEEKAETEDVTPLEVVVVKESDKDGVVVGKVDKSFVEEEVPVDEVEKASVKGPDEEKAETEDETHLEVLMMESEKLIVGKVVVEEEVSEDEVVMDLVLELVLELVMEVVTEEEMALEVVMVEEPIKDKVVEGKVEESVLPLVLELVFA